MEHKILVAFDDSKNAMRAVEFVAETFNPENKVTLLSVLQNTAALCEMNSPELTPYFVSQQDSFCVLEDKKKSLVEEAVQNAKGYLTRAGFKSENISINLIPKKKGIAGDIVDAAKSGYDIIVMGRRGVSGVKEFLFGSIAQKVLNLAKDVSVLIVN